MWMQKSLEGMSIASPGSRLHSRNNQPVSSSMSQSNGSSLQGYGDRPYVVDHDNGTWKSKLIESGQWLGEKVIEYGGRIVRGNSHSSIPNQLAQQPPRNDGRANWMADIRNSSASYMPSSGEGGCMAYQNDFKTSRPSTYSDSLSYGNTSTSMLKTQSEDFYGDSRKDNTKGKSKRHRQKEKRLQNGKKNRKKKGEDECDSVSYSESEESIPESKSSFYSDTSAEKELKSSKVRSRRAVNDMDIVGANRLMEKNSKKGKKCPKSSASVSSINSHAESIDPQEIKSRSLRTKRREKKSSSTSKQHLKSPSDSSSSEKVVTKIKKSKRRMKTQNVEVVDLLGVEELTIGGPNATPTTAQDMGLLCDISIPQESHPMLLDNLDGLRFSPQAKKPIEMDDSIEVLTFSSSDTSSLVHTPTTESAKNVETLACNILPENNLVDLDALVAVKGNDTKHNSSSQKSLNDMRRMRQHERPVSSMNPSSNPTDPRNVTYMMVPMPISMPFLSMQQAPIIPQQQYSQHGQHLPAHVQQHCMHAYNANSHEEEQVRL